MPPHKLTHTPKIIFLVLTLLAGLFVIGPTLDYEPILTQGDHGRDLYCFKKTFDGASPYRDYWWQYGPLMPYYYSLFFKIFGVSIQSVLLGRALLVFVSGVLVYAISLTLMTPALAFVTAFFFWVNRPDFFYTFNHIGGVPAILLVMAALFYYRQKPRRFYFYLGWIGVVLLSLVRLNLGLAALAAYGAGLVLNDCFSPTSLKKAAVLRYVAAGGVTLLVVAAVYAGFLYGLPPSHLKQSLPYFSSYRYDNAPPLKALSALGQTIFVNFTATWPRRLLALVLLVSGLRIATAMRQGRLAGPDKEKVVFVLSSLAVFLIATAHESFVSDSIYRLMWAFPVIALLMFAVFEFGLRKFSKPFYGAVVGVLLLFVMKTAVTNDGIARYYKQPINLFAYGSNRVYIANSQWGEHVNDPTADHLAVPEWGATVKDAADFLQSHLKEGESFLALPYDALYYFLTGRDSPVYHLAFFSFIHISPDDEEEMIQALEEKGVNYILLSSRAYSLEPHLGVIGRDYGPRLARYIDEHFELAATFGDWTRPPEFTRHHGVRILRRKN